MPEKPIFVTEPSLPPLDELIPYLEEIWRSKTLTNKGPFHEQLEAAICDYLQIPFISLFCNGTIALIAALKAMGLKGEVITTPYSFVATAHALAWNGIKPVFVDIDPITLNLDPKKIEAAITPRTTGIMPVHVYGHPCEVDAIEAIAKKHNLKVLYDAAHAFAVQCHCGSVLNHGDLSVLSFHATKTFSTFEGGAIVCHDESTKKSIDQLKNFGFAGETSVEVVGINGKMNEFSAAIGLLQLRGYGAQFEKRKTVDAAYREGLAGVKGIRCHQPTPPKVRNFGYFPIFVEDDYPLSRDELYENLKSKGINGRRYFYPLLPSFDSYRKSHARAEDLLPEANRASNQVICLPMTANIELRDVARVIREIREIASVQ